MDQLEGICRRLAGEHWILFAAYAWQSYKRAGLGYVVVLLGGLEVTKGAKAPHTVSLNYVRIPLDEHGSKQPRYDPAQEILVAMDEFGKILVGPLVYRLEGGPTPPNAYLIGRKQLGNTGGLLQ